MWFKNRNGCIEEQQTEQNKETTILNKLAKNTKNVHIPFPLQRATGIGL